jgi:hypothetical protein
VFLNALQESHPLFAVKLWIAGASLPQPAPVLEIGLTDREVRLTNRISFGILQPPTRGPFVAVFSFCCFGPVQLAMRMVYVVPRTQYKQCTRLKFRIITETP